MSDRTLSYKEIEKTLRLNPVLPDVPDERDYKFDVLMAPVAELPETFSLREKMSPVKSQGTRGTCVGFGTTAITEFFNREEYKNPVLNLSEEFTFKKCKDIDKVDYNYEGYGSYTRSGAKVLKNFGTCLEKTVPYIDNVAEDYWKTEILPEKSLTEALDYRVKDYVSVPATIIAIKQALITTNAPLTAGFTLYNSYREAKTNGGVIPMKADGEAVVGGHCMAIVGWTKTHFILKNSWGSGWGDKGYVYWNYGMTNDIHSIWSFVDLTTNPNSLIQKQFEKNRAMVAPYALEAWDKGIKKGIVKANTVPLDDVTKQDLLVFLDRCKLLD
jgi:C1A family cysteine protease